MNMHQRGLGKTISLFISFFLIVTPLLSSCGGGGGSDSAGSIEQPNSGTVLISSDKLAGPDGLIVYQGEVYTGEIEVPRKCLILVQKNDEIFLYNPELGDVDVTFDNSVMSLVKYFDDFSSIPSINVNSSKSSLTSNAKSISLKTGINIVPSLESQISYIDASNHVRRWAAVKLENNSQEKEAWLLPPRGLTVDINLMRLMKRYFSGNFYDTSSSLKIWNVNPNTLVESFGATVYLPQWAKKITNVAMAESKDKELMLKINKIEAFYRIAETFRAAFNALMPIECGDIIVNSIFSVIEPYWISYIKGDIKWDTFKAAVDMAVEENFFALGNCFLELSLLVTGPPTASGTWWAFAIYEVIQTLFDILSAGFQAIDDWVDAPISMAAYNAYDSVKLGGDLAFWCYIGLNAQATTFKYFPRPGGKETGSIDLWWQGPVSFSDLNSSEGKYEGLWDENYPGAQGFAGNIKIIIDKSTNSIKSFEATKSEVWTDCPPPKPGGSNSSISGPKTQKQLSYNTAAGEHFASGASVCSDYVKEINYKYGCPGYEDYYIKDSLTCPPSGDESRLFIRITPNN